MRNSSIRRREFVRSVKRHYRRHGRDFPWRRTRDPYKILVSEIMLQQTQVLRVLLKYREFLGRFPSVHALSRATPRAVLSAWSGLGYNRRAVALLKTAKIIVREFGGKIPKDEKVLMDLPGIGPGTAGAIVAFAFNAPSVFLETNIRRAFLYFFFSGKNRVSDAEILPLVAKTLDRKNPREWYFALMDYGAMLGKEAKENPNTRSLTYRPQSRFRGSRRELRGRILASLLRRGGRGVSFFARKTGVSETRVREVMDVFLQEGILEKSEDKFFVRRRMK